MEDIVSRGIEPICGWDWIRQHQHNLDGWTPTIEISRPGYRQTFTVRSKEAMNEVVKTMRENKRK